MKNFLIKSIVIIFSILCLVTVISCQTDPTPQWQKINEKNFTFFLPNGFTRTDMRGTENYLGEFYNGKTRFLFIEDATASYAYDVRYDLEAMKDYKETETVIKGKKPS